MVGYGYITIITILEWLYYFRRMRPENALKPCLRNQNIACNITYDQNVLLKPF